jgi:hypothetical protein
MPKLLNELVLKVSLEKEVSVLGVHFASIENSYLAQDLIVEVLCVLLQVIDDALL